VRYGTALVWQRRLADRRRRGAIPDVALALEHDRVYTAGRHADVAAHVLGTTPIPVVRCERGGDVTYHGPGQLVVYPIVRLAPKSVRAYVSALEEACVRTAGDFGVRAEADPLRTGVWVGDCKLAAIGIRVGQGVAYHGLAFNVTTDLADFAGIVPCGIADAGVCSLASLGVPVTVAEVRDALLPRLAAALGRELSWTQQAEVGVGATASRLA
jgi:lipoyl(octanoyl) transferase